MKRYQGIAISGACVLGIIAGLGFLMRSLPVKLEGPEWQSIEKCGGNQARLYQSMAGYLRENGKLPDRDFLVGSFPARFKWECPACGKGYLIHPENLGKRHAAVITDEQNRHPTTFLWWSRGLHPRVQTMGDGTIHLFEGGKILTMVGSTP